MTLLASSLLMSLAWSLRGQFGHLKGALIPGLAAAAIVNLVALRERQKKPFSPPQGWPAGHPWGGLGFILSGLGFSLGGHISYGKIIHRILEQPVPDLSAFLKIFFIGAIWGGLGMSFLGFGANERPWKKQDIYLLVGLLLFWWVALGLFNLEAYDLTLYYFGFIILLAYNLLVKKSEVVSLYALTGFFSFGLAFFLAVAILFLGEKGLFGSGWAWWRLRDQILGAVGGLGVWMAARQGGKMPGTFTSGARHLSYDVKTVIFLTSTIFLCWLSSITAILKQLLACQWRCWEAAFTLFLVFSFVLTLLLFSFFPGKSGKKQ